MSFIYSVFQCCKMFSIYCFQAEDGIRDLVRSRGLGDVYKRQDLDLALQEFANRNRRFGGDVGKA